MRLRWFPDAGTPYIDFSGKPGATTGEVLARLHLSGSPFVGLLPQLGDLKSLRQLDPGPTLR